MSHKSVLQECHLDICSFPTVVAFGFVGSILFASLSCCGALLQSVATVGTMGTAVYLCNLRATVDFSRSSLRWWCAEPCFLTVNNRSIDRCLVAFDKTSIYTWQIRKLFRFPCTPFLHLRVIKVLAPAYAMAFFHAHKRRKAQT